MRLRKSLAGLAGLLWLAAPLLAADPAPGQARIARPQVEVRAGPSDKFPITATLQVNDVVYVRGTLPNSGWVEIIPPAGSFSWVPDRVVQQVQNTQTLFVLGDEVPLRVGGVGTSFPLDVEAKVKVKRGTLLVVRGEKVVHDKAGWWPVAPPPGEARYILAEALTASAAGQAVSSSKTTVGGAPGAASGEPKEWLAGLNAEKDGRYDDAYRIFATLAQQESRPGGDFSMASRCTTRMRELVEAGRVKGTLTALPRSNVPVSATPASRSGSSPVSTGNPAAPAPPLPPLGSPQTGGPGPRIAPANMPSQGTRGYLRRSGFQIDGLTTYALEDRRGDLMLYATAGPGVDLEPFVGRAVELQGPVRQRGDVRGGAHMSVTRVYPLR